MSVQRVMQSLAVMCGCLAPKKASKLLVARSTFLASQRPWSIFRSLSHPSKNRYWLSRRAHGSLTMTASSVYPARPKSHAGTCPITSG